MNRHIRKIASVFILFHFLCVHVSTRGSNRFLEVTH